MPYHHYLFTRFIINCYFVYIINKQKKNVSVFVCDQCVYYKDTYPDVTFARKESLRDAGSVKAGSGDVKGSHEEQPAHLTDCGGPEEAL